MRDWTFHTFISHLRHYGLESMAGAGLLSAAGAVVTQAILSRNDGALFSMHGWLRETLVIWRSARTPGGTEEEMPVPVAAGEPWGKVGDRQPAAGTLAPLAFYVSF